MNGWPADSGAKKSVGETPGAKNRSQKPCAVASSAGSPAACGSGGQHGAQGARYRARRALPAQHTQPARGRAPPGCRACRPILPPLRCPHRPRCSARTCGGLEGGVGVADGPAGGGGVHERHAVPEAVCGADQPLQLALALPNALQRCQVDAAAAAAQGPGASGAGRRAVSLLGADGRRQAAAVGEHGRGWRGAAHREVRPHRVLHAASRQVGRQAAHTAARAGPRATG